MTSEALHSELFAKQFGLPVLDGAVEMKFLCPQCKHKSLGANKRTGVFHCFRCHYRGLVKGRPDAVRPKQFVDSGVQLQVTQCLTEICRLEPIHREYLKKRGVYHPEDWKIVSIPARVDILLAKHFTWSELQVSGFFDETDEGYKLGTSLGYRRILIPYWSRGHIVGCKTRANPYAFDEVEIFKYIAPIGSRVGSALFYKDYPTGDVIWTEGELKVVAAAEAGFSIFGTSGATISAAAYKDLVRIIAAKTTRRFFIALDSSPKMWRDPAIIGSMFRTLRVAPARTAVLIQPLAKGEEKMDLDLLLARDGPEELDYLIERSWSQRASLNNKVTATARRLKLDAQATGPRR